jgi:2-hydroxychromene-2-carboxylate isomerase
LTDKDKWIEVERRRWAHLFSIPIREVPPPDFPPLTLTIMRALCALTLLHPGKEGQGPLTKALDELYREFWVNHKKTNEKDVLAEVLGKVLGKEETEKSMFSCPYLSAVSFWTR